MLLTTFLVTGPVVPQTKPDDAHTTRRVRQESWAQQTDSAALGKICLTFKKQNKKTRPDKGTQSVCLGLRL